MRENVAAPPISNPDELDTSQGIADLTHFSAVHVGTAYLHVSLGQRAINIAGEVHEIGGLCARRPERKLRNRNNK
jgi:hypothetical protein